MNSIPSPYNFVEVEDRVVFLDESEYPQIDVPFRDGVSGKIDVEFEATSPIYIRAEGNHDKDEVAQTLAKIGNNPDQIARDSVLSPYSRFYRLPDGRYALPGTSVKGMIRSVLEIVSFSRMFGVEDDRYGIRDLNSRQDDIYKAWITKSTPLGHKAKALAGWMYLDADKNWRLQPCRHGRIEHHILDGLQQRIRYDKQASRTYQSWTGSLDIYVRFSSSPWEDVTIKSQRADKLAMVYVDEANRSEVKGYTPVTVVFTGCPTNRKHREFVFERFNRGEEDPEITEEVQKDFLFLHEDHSDWNDWWKPRLNSGEPIPVFYLATDSEKPSIHSAIVPYAPRVHLHSIGLCQMHKLAYANRVRSLLPARHRAEGMDIAESIFGRVSDKKETKSFRGRVNVEPFAALHDPEPLAPHVAVLNGPKPSYFPNYLKQTANSQGTVARDQYQTYHDSSATLRGWKRYPVRADHSLEAPISNDPPGRNYKVATVFSPLPHGTRFKGTIHFHNLRPWELGALLWSLRLGSRGSLDDNPRRHSIGMAKPLGCGLIRLTSLAMTARPVRPMEQPLAEQDYMTTFESFMAAKLGAQPELRRRRQIEDLLAMTSTKNLRDPRELTYPTLNEFAEFKTGSWILVPFKTLNELDPWKPEPKPVPKPAVATRPPPPEPPKEAQPAAVETIEIEILEKNKKGKWKAKVPDAPVGCNGLVEGELPGDIAPARRYRADVLSKVHNQWRFSNLISL